MLRMSNIVRHKKFSKDRVPSYYILKRSGPIILYNTPLNPIEKFKVAILHLNRNWNL